MTDTKFVQQQVQLTIPLSDLVALQKKVEILEAENEHLKLKVQEQNEIIENHNKKSLSDARGIKMSGFRTP